MKLYYTYIVKCSDNTYYAGVTNDLERRIDEHNKGINPESFTFNRRPVELMYFAEFNDIYEAISYEKQIKGWTKNKKEALIQGDNNRLKELAECKNKTSHKHFKKHKN